MPFASRSRLALEAQRLGFWKVSMFGRSLREKAAREAPPLGVRNGAADWGRFAAAVTAVAQETRDLRRPMLTYMSPDRSIQPPPRSWRCSAAGVTVSRQNLVKFAICPPPRLAHSGDAGFVCRKALRRDVSDLQDSRSAPAMIRHI